MGATKFGLPTNVDEDQISVVRIVQATTAKFTDLFFQRAFVLFIENGSKHVTLRSGCSVHGETGDVLVFDGNSFVTLENRVWSGADYAATGVLYPARVVEAVFSRDERGAERPPVQRVAQPNEQIAASIRAAAAVQDVPLAVREHRYSEPLQWLKSVGLRVSVASHAGNAHRLRTLIENDIGRPWRSKDAARRLAVSEATLRRQLAKSGTSFSMVVRTARLERALSLLQTTDAPVSEIALACGFSTPSHFSESFRARFGVQPRAIRIPMD